MIPVSHFFTIQDFKNYYGDHYYVRKLNNLPTDHYIKNLIKDKRNNMDLYIDYRKYKNKKNLHNVKLFRKDQVDFIHRQTKVKKNT